MRLAEPLPLRIGPPPARPRVMLSETAPGPTWIRLDSLGHGLPSTPRLVSLTEQADALVASEGLDYATALRRASIEDPAAYQRWRQQIRPGVR